MTNVRLCLDHVEFARAYRLLERRHRHGAAGSGVEASAFRSWPIMPRTGSTPYTVIPAKAGTQEQAPLRRPGPPLSRGRRRNTAIVRDLSGRPLRACDLAEKSKRRNIEMFISFFPELRGAKVPVSLREYLTLMEAMQRARRARSTSRSFTFSRARRWSRTSAISTVSTGCSGIASRASRPWPTHRPSYPRNG